jgi:MoaA/NifB/PqqE/SkfB family radical SAM enzyme
MAELGVKSVNFSGGEATMRLDLPELITATKRLKLVPILLTNGLLLSKQRAALVEAGIDYIIVSLDSLSQDVYQLQRGVPLQGALNGVEAALQMRKEDNHNLVIGATTVITRHNLKQLPAILEWLTERRISLQITPYHHFDQSTDDCLSPQNEDELRSVIAKLIKMRDNGYLLCNSLAYLRWIPDYVFKSKLPDDYRCYVGYTGVFVDADLNLRPCWSWSIPVVANLRTENLIKAWQLDAFKKGREQVHKLNCSKCWLLCTSEFSLRFLE